MNKFMSRAAVAGAVLLMAMPVMAQMHQRVSPHETISSVVDDDRVTIVYGRPYTKDPKTGAPRVIWGNVIPWGQVWRTGADEATLLITQKPLTIGGARLRAGAYTLWTIPNENGSAQLIINRQIGQWGVDPHEPANAYDPHQDVARVDLTKATVAPVDEFTMAVDKNPAGGGTLTMAWETTQWSVPFTVRR